MAENNARCGNCCIGTLCKNPQLELRAEHTCPICNEIVHTIGCAEFDMTLNKYVCISCVAGRKAGDADATQPPSNQPPPPPVLPPLVAPLIPNLPPMMPLASSKPK